MKVLITRSEKQSGEFAKQLENSGVETVFFPTIAITPPLSWKETDSKIKQIENYTDIIFSSANGVHYFLNRLKKIRSIDRIKAENIYTIGLKAKKEIEKFNLNVPAIPSSGNSAAMATEILSSPGKEERKFLFPHGNLEFKYLVRSLSKEKLIIDHCTVYRNTIPHYTGQQVNKVQEMLLKGTIDIITFFSPSAINNFIKIFRNLSLFSKVKIAVIGNTTRSACLKHGLIVDICPSPGNNKLSAGLLAKLIVAHNIGIILLSVICFPILY